MGHSASVKADTQGDRNRQIDLELRQAKREITTTIKILLLGTGESGKSTILKQFRILHDSGFTRAELGQLVAHIHGNVVEGLRDLVEALPTLGLSFAGPDLGDSARLVLKMCSSGLQHEPIGPELRDHLRKLWEDPSVQEAFERRNEFQLTDSIEYFMGRLDSICSVGYVPTDSDVLFARVPSKGVQELRIPFRDFTLKLVDVAGQRSERRKWLQCFSSVESVLFVLAVSEYDMRLAEDGQSNRLREALGVFASVSAHSALGTSSLIVFLNKMDIFALKLARSPIAAHFPAFQEAQTYSRGIQFFRHEVAQRSGRPESGLYVHETCATDTDQVKFVLDSCLDMIMQHNLKKIGVNM